MSSFGYKTMLKPMCKFFFLIICIVYILLQFLIKIFFVLFSMKVLKYPQSTMYGCGKILPFSGTHVLDLPRSHLSRLPLFLWGFSIPWVLFTSTGYLSCIPQGSLSTCLGLEPLQLRGSQDPIVLDAFLVLVCELCLFLGNWKWFFLFRGKTSLLYKRTQLSL